jgi:CBS domain-containing protein/PII-like signaling protein
MQPTESCQLWIYIDEGDSLRGRSLANIILDMLRAAGCPGATVMRGIGGYGARGIIHSDLSVELTSRLPLVITCIDRAERIEALLPTLGEVVSDGLIALTPVQVVSTGQRERGPFPRHLTVADVMSRDVACVSPDTPVGELVALLIDRALRALPVVDDARQVVGMITDGDLLARGATTLPLRLKQLLPLGERAARVTALDMQPQRAAELMTPQPLTLSAETPLAQAAALMADRGLKRLPVVDAQGRLVGLVSRSDLLKTVAEGLRQHPDQPPQLPVGAPEQVGALMFTNVPTVTPATPLSVTLERLMANEKRRVVVVDAERRVVGIITDGDVLRRAGRRVQAGTLQRLAAWLGGGPRPEELELESSGRTAAEVMTSPVVTVSADTQPAEAIRRIMARQVKRLPLVDGQGRLVGMVGRATLMRAMSGGGSA